MDLEKLRENIDSIDRQIVSLINERYKYVQEVGKWKQNEKKPFLKSSKP
jgi:chorismate mutase